jgi:hypothetical protein
MSNLTLLLVLALCMSQPLIANTFTYVVHIENWFKNHILQAPCNSGDEDLGLKHIRVNSEFQWKCSINLWHTTLYFCNLSWMGGHRTFDMFYVEDNLLHNNCSFLDCYWMAQENGIYLFSMRSGQFFFLKEIG